MFSRNEEFLSTGRQHETEQLASLIADQMQLEAVEPSHRALSPLCQSLEYLMQVYPLVPADSQCRAVHKTYPRAPAHQALLQEQDERHDYSPLQLGEPVVRHRSRKQMTHMHKDIPDIEMFQTFVPTEVEQYHDGNDFRI